MNKQRTLRTGAAALLAAALMACGGGGGGRGGGGGSVVDPPPAGDGRATLTAASGERAVATAVWAVAMPLSVVRQLHEDLLALHDERMAETITPCPGVQPGRIERRWTDADGNRRLSAGDRVEWRVVRCGREAWRADFDASALIRVRLTRVDASATFGAAGTVEFVEPLVAPVLLDGPAGTRLSGSFDFDAQRSVDTIALRASASARDDLLVDTPGSPQRRALRGFAFGKTVLMTSARIELSARGTLDSSDLGGAVELSTPAPLLAYLDTAPERHAGQGQVVLRGRSPAQIRLSAGAGDGRSWTAEFDADGDGGSDAVLAGPWGVRGSALEPTTRRDGLLFADPRSRALTDLRPFDGPELRIAPIYERTGSLRAGQPLQVQFSRPIEPASVPAELELIEDDCEGVGLKERRVRAHAMTVQGALLSFTPHLPFKPCSTVSLRPAGGLLTGEILAATGSGRVPAFGLATFSNTVQPTLLAVPRSDRGLLTDTRPVVLDARAADGPEPVERWQWSHVSGPAVVFSSPQASTTELRLAAGAGGAETLRLRLTVENIVGETSWRDFTLSTLAADSVPRFALVRQWSGGGPSRDWVYADGPGGVLSVSGSAGALSATWVRSGEGMPAFLMNLLLEPGSALAPGRYALPSPGFWPHLSLGGSDGVQACSGAGEIVVHTLRRDADGSLAELALDADRDCGTALRQTLALRLNSAQPLPP